MNAREQILDEQYKRDPHKFIFEALRTKDEHNKENPVGRFPDELCIRATLDDYLVGGKIFAPKKRSIPWLLELQLSTSNTCTVVEFASPKNQDTLWPRGSRVHTYFGGLVTSITN